MEHELEALKTEFAEFKVKQEADFETEINSLKELIRDLCGDVGEIMLMHNGQEEDLNSRLDRHCFDINQLREDHNSLREDYQELEAEAAALRICLHDMQNCLCHCAERCNPPISAVGSPDLPKVPASPVRVVRPAYYLELQRINGGGCGRNLSIKGGAKVLEEINKSGCVATVALISYIKESVFYLLRKMTRNCIKENITVQRSCSWRSVVITNRVFSIDKGENGEGDRANRKRSSFNTPLKVVISC